MFNYSILDVKRLKNLSIIICDRNWKVTQAHLVWFFPQLGGAPENLFGTPKTKFVWDPS